MALLPPKSPKEKSIGISVYLPESLWARLERIAQETKEDDPEGEGYSRNEVCKQALLDFCDAWDRERSSKKKR